MKEITERQKDVLFFISDFIEKNSYPPTVREISSSFGISVRAVQDHLRALERKGYITHTPGNSRSIKVENKQNEKGKETVAEKSQVIVLAFILPAMIKEKEEEKKEA